MATKFERPAIGSVIRVTTDYSAVMNGLYANNVPRKDTKVGKVIPSEDWDDVDTFRLMTNNASYPVSVIPMDRVSMLEYARQSAEVLVKPEDSEEFLKADKPLAMVSRVEETPKPTVPENQSFEVAGSKGNTYVVTKEGTRFSCTCPAGSFGRVCKHVTQVKKDLGLI